MTPVPQSAHLPALSGYCRWYWFSVFWSSCQFLGQFLRSLFLAVVLSYCTQGLHWKPFFLPLVVVIVIQSITNRKRNGVSRQPWRTPVVTSNVSDNWSPWTTLQDMWLALIRNTVMPRNLLQCISAEAVESLLIVDKVNVDRRLHSSACSTMIRCVQNWSIQDLFLRNLTCWSRGLASTAIVILSNNILLNTFPGIDNSMIAL